MDEAVKWTAVIAACVIATVTLVGYFINARVNRHARIESDAKEQRLDTYRQIIALMIAHAGQHVSTESHPDLRALAMNILLFASDDVVRAWRRFVDHGRVGTNDEQTLRAALGALLLSIRRDAGRGQTRLDEREVLGALGLVTFAAAERDSK
jgi:hypothetical protein